MTRAPAEVIPEISPLQSISEWSRTSRPTDRVSSSALEDGSRIVSKRYLTKAQPIRRAVSFVRSSPTTPLMSYSLKIFAETISHSLPQRKLTLLAKLTLKNAHDPLHWPSAAMGTPKEGRGFKPRRTSCTLRRRTRSPDAAVGRFSALTNLPSVMRKGLVGICHSVRLFLLLDGAAYPIGRVDNLGCQLLRHIFTCPFPRKLNKPSDRKGIAPRGTYIHRHLIGCPAHTPGLDLNRRFDIVYGGPENLYRIRRGLLFYNIQRPVKHPL